MAAEERVATAVSLQVSKNGNRIGRVRVAQSNSYVFVCRASESLTWVTGQLFRKRRENVRGDLSLEETKVRIDDRLHWPDIFLRWGSTSGQYEVRTYPLMAVVAVVALLGCNCFPEREVMQ